MDPITVTTTLITLASFIKDLIEVGQSIKSSIEKVGENRRRIRELTNDVLHTLSDLANLTRGQEDAFQAPALLSALGNLKAEMLHVLSICREITPVQRPGFRRVGSQIKVWMKRDDLEKKIGRLKEHVNKCYLQFTTFSSARIEQTTARIEETAVQAVNSTLRVEQTLIVNNVESQVKLRHLEGMMAHLLLETQFGQNVLNQTMEIIASDATHKSLESQYLSAQTRSLMDSLQKCLTGGNLILQEPLSDPNEPLQLVLVQSTPLNTLHQILGAVLKVNESPTVQIQLNSMEEVMVGLGIHLDNIGMKSEAIAWERLRIRILHSLAAGHHCVGILCEIASALGELSIGYLHLFQFQAALQASQQSLDLWHHISESLPEVDNRTGQLIAMAAHAQNLLETGQGTAALSTAQDAVAISRSMATQLIESVAGSSPLTEEDEYRAVLSCDAIFRLAEALSSVDRNLESYEASMEGFQTVLRLRFLSRRPPGRDIDSFLDQICKVAEEGTFSLGMLADCVTLFRDLARMYPQKLSFPFLQLFHAYVYLSQHNTPLDSGSALETLRLFIEPTEDRPTPELDITMCIDFSALGIATEDVVRAYYTCPSHSFGSLMRNIFVTHFEQAVAVLRETVQELSTESNIIPWALSSISDIVPLVSKSQRMNLLQLLTKNIPRLGTILTRWRPDLR
ncbi:Tetratricopeptide repeat family [Mycena venus]|uniref:Tetratricopeptide repeat family n=1 Tax=Mycena venus TaxID=2733690 RepID=A0A8H7D1C9_9AGAR|nr:Tetratricopeptide repeat family [Mycena venus]